MTRLSYLVCSCVLVGNVLCAAELLAQPPDALTPYRIAPRLSRLHVTGGFAGVSNRYLLTGEYDLIHPIAWAGDASINSATIWGSLISDHPTIAIVEDVDRLLNIEAWKGEKLPVAGPFDAYKFRGETLDGAIVNAQAAVIGPWMYLRGVATPPPNTADFFSYQFRIAARSRFWADANEDGVVDAADYTSLRDKLDSGVSLVGASLSDWQSQFGESEPSLEAFDAALSAAVGSSASLSAAVPEPGSCALAILLIALSYFRVACARPREHVL